MAVTLFTRQQTVTVMEALKQVYINSIKELIKASSPNNRFPMFSFSRCTIKASKRTGKQNFDSYEKPTQSDEIHKDAYMGT